MPVLTPMADDSSRPFLHCQQFFERGGEIDSRPGPAVGPRKVLEGDQEVTENQTTMHEKGDQPAEKFATVRVPDIYKRLIKLPTGNALVLIDDVIKEFIAKLFPGYRVLSTGTYRVMRDMDLDVAEEDTSDLLRAVQHQLRAREHGSVMRLEIEEDFDGWLEHHLIDRLQVDEAWVYRVNGPVDLTFLKKLSGMVEGHADLRYAPYQAYQDPALDMDHNIFAAIREKDHLLQHPYDNFQSVVNFIHQAAEDPKTLAIKMTLYRVSRIRRLSSTWAKLLSRASKSRSS